jgi:hypothetical protein
MGELAVTVTPPVMEDIFSAQYHLAGLTYINGVTIMDDPTGKHRSIQDLEKARTYIDRALKKLSPTNG